jgi:methionyl-tRNA synthetase
LLITQVTEQNWFFRLSSYRQEIFDLIRSGTVEVTPAERRNEVLGFLAGEVHDLSVSRPLDRAAGWGIPVPDDPGQVVYVWFDALANYVTGLGYGSECDAPFRRWWAEPVERAHVIGKGIVRFHAVYWVAFLLSAGLPLPSRILVHDYLTVQGAKIAKSGARAADPLELVAAHGQDALRWWLLREPALVGTTDFTIDRLVDSYNHDLANTIGNLASRTLTLARRAAPWRTPALLGGEQLGLGATALPDVVGTALDRYDFRTATRGIVDLAAAANRLLEAEAPWTLARAADQGDARAAARFEAVIGSILPACTAIAEALSPLTPAGAQRLRNQLGQEDGRPTAAFPRLSGDPTSR